MKKSSPKTSKAENSKRYYEKNKAAYAARSKARYAAKREQILAQQKEYYQDNKEEICAKGRQRFRDNPEPYRIRTAARDKRMSNRRFPGFSKQIQEIYANCPEGYEVDHIDPIKADDRSGLHVPWNLQYVTKEENRRKGNDPKYICKSAITPRYKVVTTSHFYK